MSFPKIFITYANDQLNDIFSVHDTSILPITENIPLTTRLNPAPTGGESSHTNPSSPYDELRKEFPDLWPPQSSPPAQLNNNNPWPDLSDDLTPPARNPWYLRPNAFHVPIKLPMPLSPIYIPSLHADQDNKTEGKQKRASFNRLSAGYTALSGSSTPHLPPSNSPNCPLPPLPTPTGVSSRHPPQEERHRSSRKKQKKKESDTQDSTANGGVSTVPPLKSAAPWSPFASDHKNTTLGVDTRVWSSQKEKNNKEDHYPGAHTQDSAVIHQTISHSSRSTGPQLSPPPPYSVAMGEASFASTTSHSQPEQQQIGTALGHPLGHAPPRGRVMVRVETEIESSSEVIDRRERDDSDQLGEKA